MSVMALMPDEGSENTLLAADLVSRMEIEPALMFGWLVPRLMRGLWNIRDSQQHTRPH